MAVGISGQRHDLDGRKDGAVLKPSVAHVTIFMCREESTPDLWHTRDGSTDRCSHTEGTVRLVSCRAVANR